MEQVTSKFGEPVSPTPVKLCECGCGEPAPIAKHTVTKLGYVKGQPIRFINGHHFKLRRPRTGARTLSVQTGQRLGLAVVVDPDVMLDQPGKQRARAARLRCDCGTEYVRRLADIFKRPDTQSCSGHASHTDLIGRRFGKLTAIRMTGTVRRGALAQAQWLCRCDCGNEVTAIRNHLIGEKGVRSCGCSRFGPKTGYGLGDAAVTEVMRWYRGSARNRGLSWGLTRDDFKRLTSLDCHYCGTAPALIHRVSPTSGEYVYNGLDRVDNTIGYTPANVVPCCQMCNFAKRDIPYDDFLGWIARLTSFHFFRPEMTPARLLAPAA